MPKQILNDDMMWQKIEYSHNNPVNRGFVDDPIHRRWSGARNYVEHDGLVDVVTDWRYRGQTCRAPPPRTPGWFSGRCTILSSPIPSSAEALKPPGRARRRKFSTASLTGGSAG